MSWDWKDWSTRDTTTTGKFICTGIFYLPNADVMRGGTLKVIVPSGGPRKFLVHIFPTMLEAWRPFDRDNSIYVDIFSVDGKRMDISNGFGGACFFGAGYQGAFDMGISSWVGWVSSEITLRIYLPNFEGVVGASYVIMEL